MTFTLGTFHDVNLILCSMSHPLARVALPVSRGISEFPAQEWPQASHQPKGGGETACLPSEWSPVHLWGCWPVPGGHVHLLPTWANGMYNSHWKNCISVVWCSFAHNLWLGHTLLLQVLREGRPNDGGAFRELNKHSEKMFARDLPFYLIIAFRVHK